MESIFLYITNIIQISENKVRETAAKNKLIGKLICGASAGVAAKTVIAPIELVKMQFQVSDEKDIKPYMIPVLEAFKLDPNTDTNSYSKYQYLNPAPAANRIDFLKLHGLLKKYPQTNSIISNLI